MLVDRLDSAITQLAARITTMHQTIARLPASYRLHEDDARTALKDLPENSVHCVVTSPPYFGLRMYQVAPMVWGGNEECDHVWQVGKGQKMGGGIGTWTVGQHADDRTHFSSPSATCLQCGAWRGHLGLEPTPEDFIAHLVEIFRAVKRVLRPDGTLWLNVGDSYWGSGKGYGNTKPSGKQASNAGSLLYQHEGSSRPPTIDAHPTLKDKDLLGIPWMLAFALRADGWYLRQANIWHKPNAMPSSVRDRPATDYEYVFLLAKSPRYFYDDFAVRQPHSEESRRRAMRGNSATNKYANNPALPAGVHPNTMSQPRAFQGYERMDETIAAGGTPLNPAGRNLRAVWTIPSQPRRDKHFATYPDALVETCLKAGTSDYGCCAVCGAPYRRTTEPTPEYAELLTGDWADHEQDAREGRGHFTLPDGSRATQRPTKRGAPSVTAAYVTTGWASTCGHRAERVPCTVLDPFNGIGTTGVVALRMDRSYLGIDLSPQYVAATEAKLQALLASQ